MNKGLFKDDFDLLIDTLINSNINKKEKDYRRNSLTKIYKRMTDCNIILMKYYAISHEIKSLKLLERYDNFHIANDHLSESGTDFQILNKYKIECVACSSGDEKKNGLDKFHGEGIFDYGKKENIILTRITQALKEKKDFFYEHEIKNKKFCENSYIIFLSLGNLLSGTFLGDYGFVLNKILFGVGYEQFYYDQQKDSFSKSSYSHNNQILNHNKSEIDCNIFLNKEYSCISGIILATAYLGEEYNNNNIFLFTNPYSKKKINLKDFKNIVYWKAVKDDKSLIYAPFKNGRKLPLQKRKIL